MEKLTRREQQERADRIYLKNRELRVDKLEQSVRLYEAKAKQDAEYLAALIAHHAEEIKHMQGLATKRSDLIGHLFNVINCLK